MTYPRLVSTCAALFALLCLGLLLAPATFVALFGLEPSTGAEVMARRSGVLFAGLALLFLALRSTADPKLRAGVSVATCVTMVGMAALGLAELVFGRVGLGILIPVVVEAALAVLFLPHLCARA